MILVNKVSLIVRLFAIIGLCCPIIYAQESIGQMNYSASCQDVGYNSIGENILTNCSSGILTAPECSFTVNANDLHVSCDGANYVFMCGDGSYSGYWYTVAPAKYKCVS